VRDVGSLRRVRGGFCALRCGRDDTIDHASVDHNERSDDHGANGGFYDHDDPTSDDDDRPHDGDD
jgi:hypothetical protein